MDFESKRELVTAEKQLQSFQTKQKTEVNEKHESFLFDQSQDVYRENIKLFSCDSGEDLQLSETFDIFQWLTERDENKGEDFFNADDYFVKSDDELKEDRIPVKSPRNLSTKGTTKTLDVGTLTDHAFFARRCDTSKINVTSKDELEQCYLIPGTQLHMLKETSKKNQVISVCYRLLAVIVCKVTSSDNTVPVVVQLQHSDPTHSIPINSLDKCNCTPKDGLLILDKIRFPDSQYFGTKWTINIFQGGQLVHRYPSPIQFFSGNPKIFVGNQKKKKDPPPVIHPGTPLLVQVQFIEARQEHMKFDENKVPLEMKLVSSKSAKRNYLVYPPTTEPGDHTFSILGLPGTKLFKIIQVQKEQNTLQHPNDTPDHDQKPNNSNGHTGHSNGGSSFREHGSGGFLGNSGNGSSDVEPSDGSDGSDDSGGSDDESPEDISPTEDIQITRIYPKSIPIGKPSWVIIRGVFKGHSQLKIWFGSLGGSIVHSNDYSVVAHSPVFLHQQNVAVTIQNALLPQYSTTLHNALTIAAPNIRVTPTPQQQENSNSALQEHHQLESSDIVPLPDLPNLPLLNQINNSTSKKTVSLAVSPKVLEAPREDLPDAPGMQCQLTESVPQVAPQEPSRRCFFGKNDANSTNDDNTNPIIFPLRTKSDTDVNSSPRIRKAEGGDNYPRSLKRSARESCSALPGLEDDDFHFVNFKLDRVLNEFPSQKTTLPVVGIKDGVKYISSELLCQVLTKVCAPDAVVMVVDCRFAYEFNGGHIQNAINIKTSDDVEKHFLHSPIKSDQRLIVVFYCEFSSHRGRAMCKHLRKKDREINLATYPELFYPELYVLEGGYKKFYTEFPQLCDPQGYITMFDPNFSDEKKRNITLLKQPKRSMSTGSVSQPKIRITQRHSMNGLHSQSDDMVMETSPTRPQGHVQLDRPSDLHTTNQSEVEQDDLGSLSCDNQPLTTVS